MGRQYYHRIDRAEKDMRTESVADILSALNKKARSALIFLFLDYDGTLTPIARSPDEARMPASTRKLLQDLTGLSRVRLAVISGRSLRDIERQVRLKGIVYAGNHGLDIEAPGTAGLRLVPLSATKTMRTVYKDLKHALSGITGILLEDKGAILSIHYRLASREQVKIMRAVIKRVLYPFIAQKKLKLSAGKKVIDVKPPVEWSKGHAVSWILETAKKLFQNKKIMPVYFGDDITDEDAFRRIGRNGMTIRVGRSKKTSAQYRLKNTREVYSFLNQLDKQEKQP
jgi:trehalose 6-phosphate phosphatase